MSDDDDVIYYKGSRWIKMLSYILLDVMWNVDNTINVKITLQNKLKVHLKINTKSLYNHI